MIAAAQPCCPDLERLAAQLCAAEPAEADRLHEEEVAAALAQLRFADAILWQRARIRAQLLRARARNAGC